LLFQSYDLNHRILNKTALILFKVYNHRNFTRVKKFTVIFSLFMLFKPVLPVVEYIVFYDYIKNELCVNKDKPEMKCNGKCHLMKEMSKASDTPENGQDKKHFSVELHEVFLNDLQETFVVFPPMQIGVEKINSTYNNLYTYRKIASVFHPPAFV